MSAPSLPVMLDASPVSALAAVREKKNAVHVELNTALTRLDGARRGLDGARAVVRRSSDARSREALTAAEDEVRLWSGIVEDQTAELGLLTQEENFQVRAVRRLEVGGMIREQAARMDDVQARMAAVSRAEMAAVAARVALCESVMRSNGAAAVLRREVERVATEADLTGLDGRAGERDAVLREAVTLCGLDGGAVELLSEIPASLLPALPPLPRLRLDRASLASGVDDFRDRWRAAADSWEALTRGMRV